MVGIEDITNIFLVNSPLDIVLNYILPIPIVAYALYLFLGEIKLMHSATVRAILGVIFASTVVLFFRMGIFALWGGIAGIIIFKVKNWPGRLIALVIFLFIITQITNLTLANINPQQILFLVFGGFALLSLTMVEGLIKQVLIVVAIFVIYFVVITYLLPRVII